MNSPVHVAVGVIANESGQILLAKRPEHLHQGGLWEFPGGKVEPGEPVPAALKRELSEELGIDTLQCHPLIQIRHNYSDKAVFLDVWKVTQFTGIPAGCEGQEIRWVEPAHLVNYTFPAANQPIVNAARLPSGLLITGQFESSREFMQHLESAIEQGIKLVQLRAHTLSPESYLQLCKQAFSVCCENGAYLISNTSPELFSQCQAHGLHVTSQRLMALQQRPVSKDYWFSASCHNPEEIAQAERLEADYVTLSPINQTASHPETAPLGWQQFASWVNVATLPVYALGGLAERDLYQAQQNGAQGVAAVSAFWSRQIPEKKIQ